jgi:molecular chaperone DnaK
MHVSAKDLGTGKEQKIKIEAASQLPDDEIDRMVKDAESHAEEDQKRRELATARNEADNLIYAIESSVNDHGDKISESDKQEIENAIQGLKKALEQDSLDEIRNGIDTLTQASHKISEILYQESAHAEGAEAAGAAAGSDATSSSTGEAEDQGADSDVVDAEFEVEDEDKS